MKLRTLIFLRLPLAFFALLFIISFASFALAQTPVLDDEEKAFLKLINDYRVANSLGTLQVSLAITTATDWMSNDMATNNYFSHTDSLGRDPFVRMRAFGYNYNTWMGENIAAGFSDALSTFNQFKNSPPHNAAMLTPEFKVIGISRVTNLAATYRHYWTTDFGGFVDATIDTNTAPVVTTVNAANYTNAVAPLSIAALFGTNLATGTFSANGIPLPKTLGGTTITINNVAAELLYVSPTQINYVIPDGIAAGTATLEVKLNSTLVGKGTATISNVAPSIFTITADGRGIPAGYATPDNKIFQSLFNPNGTSRPISPGTVQAPNYLILFGTGIRKRSSLANVRVTVGGLLAQVDYAGDQFYFVGVDQLNIVIPPTSRGSGETDVIVTIDGKPANTVRVNIGN